MKLLRAGIGAVLGITMVTLLAWAGLYLFGALILHGQGSLFDTNPSAANLFFAGWFVSMAAAAALGGCLGYLSSGDEAKPQRGKE